MTHTSTPPVLSSKKSAEDGASHELALTSLQGLRARARSGEVTPRDWRDQAGVAGRLERWVTGAAVAALVLALHLGVDWLPGPPAQVTAFWTVILLGFGLSVGAGTHVLAEFLEGEPAPDLRGRLARLAWGWALAAGPTLGAGLGLGAVAALAWVIPGVGAVPLVLGALLYPAALLCLATAERRFARAGALGSLVRGHARLLPWGGAPRDPSVASWIPGRGRFTLEVMAVVGRTAVAVAVLVLFAGAMAMPGFDDRSLEQTAPLVPPLLSLVLGTMAVSLTLQTGAAEVAARQALQLAAEHGDEAERLEPERLEGEPTS